MLGDRQALREAFPSLKEAVLESYTQDSICGTWERLADAVYKGGSQALARLNWHDRGREKCIWAEKIGPHMDIKSNLSPSFNYFVRKVKELTM